jgi:hypothetical protein
MTSVYGAVVLTLRYFMNAPFAQISKVNTQKHQCQCSFDPAKDQHLDQWWFVKDQGSNTSKCGPTNAKPIIAYAMG